MKNTVPETINAYKEFTELYEHYNRQEKELIEKFKQDKHDISKKKKQLDHLLSTLFLNQINNIPSQMLLASEKMYLIKLCAFQSRTRWQLIYKASQDGFASKDFHRKCDSVSQTLTIVKTIDGFIFGGYTELPWHSNDEYSKDENAFLFSLVNHQNDPIKLECVKPEFAIYNYEEYGPTFGRGYDIFISDHSNSNLESCCNLVVYTHARYECDSTVLAGTENFQTDDIEVFAKLQ